MGVETAGLHAHARAQVSSTLGRSGCSVISRKIDTALLCAQKKREVSRLPLPFQFAWALNAGGNSDGSHGCTGFPSPKLEPRS